MATKIAGWNALSMDPTLVFCRKSWDDDVVNSMMVTNFHICWSNTDYLTWLKLGRINFLRVHLLIILSPLSATFSSDRDSADKRTAK